MSSHEFQFNNIHDFNTPESIKQSYQILEALISPDKRISYPSYANPIFYANRLFQQEKSQWME